MHISNKELFTGIMVEKNVRWHDDGKTIISICNIS